MSNILFTTIVFLFELVIILFISPNDVYSISHHTILCDAMSIINGSDTVVSDVKSALNFTHEGLYAVFNFLFKSIYPTKHSCSS